MVCNIVICIVSLAYSNGIVVQEINENIKDQKDNVVVLVDKYIQDSKGWDSKNYRIEFKRRIGDKLVYRVIHKDDEFYTGTTAGGGKSVEVHVNAEGYEILQEFRFQ